MRPLSRGGALCAALLLLHGACAGAAKNPAAHRFAVIGNTFLQADGEAALKQAIANNSDPGLAFVVVTGIKSSAEACTDKLYEHRRDLLDEARRPVIPVPSAADWSECSTEGRSTAADRLARWREIFAAEPSSLGAHTLALTRLSTSAKFRSYAEDAHWKVGDVMYASINLPANNNHYRPEAGRNSEFEDRLVANRFWLRRLLSFARRDKLKAIVLFSEGDVKAFSQPTGLRALLGRPSGSPRDGFDEVRKQIGAMAQKFSGKVLLIDAAGPAAGAPAIVWRGNLGHLSLGAKTVDLQVNSATPTIFSIAP